MPMTLKEWRKKKKFTQQTLAEALEAFARDKFPTSSAKNLKQTTVGYWERGTLPRKWWLSVIKEFTNGQVSPGDFISGQ
jgi:transcriptional regulator with XRE-family HTH domain